MILQKISNKFRTELHTCSAADALHYTTTLLAAPFSQITLLFG